MSKEHPRKSEEIARQIATGILECDTCGLPQPLSEYNKNTHSKHGYWYTCKPCIKERRKPTPTERSFKQNLRIRFNLSLKEFEDMLAAQDNKCAICDTEFSSTKERHIDHDHKCCSGSKKVCGRCIRGILCRACNHALGLLKEDTERLDAMIEYIERWKVIYSDA